MIWATGYRDRTDWVRVPGAVDADGRFIERNGISPAPGLFFIGRSWQTSRGSALVTGVGRDAAGIAARVEASLAVETAADAGSALAASVA